MGRHTTLQLETAEELLAKAGIEPIIVDGKLVALRAPGLRIAPAKGGEITVFSED
jgi:hypothetical protein